jgi:hypothetical protein
LTAGTASAADGVRDRGTETAGRASNHRLVLCRHRPGQQGNERLASCMHRVAQLAEPATRQPPDACAQGPAVGRDGQRPVPRIEIFLRQAPLFEEMLTESGFTLTKLWFSVTQSEQRTRFAIRQIDPVRRWKLSPMDIESLDRWDDYTLAKEAMIEHTDTDHAPWTSIKSNDKKRARINAMRFFLTQFDYDGKDPSVVYPADPLLVQRGRDSIKD